LDKEANEFLKKNPKKIFTRTMQEGENINFYAYSADIATSDSCISCHMKVKNKPIKIGDILGIRTYRFNYAQNAKIGNFELNANLDDYKKAEKVFLEP
jgi:hypothetical protein